MIGAIARLERPLLVAAVLDDQGRRFGNLYPCTRQVPERFGDDRPIPLGQLLKPSVVGVQAPKRIDVLGEEEGAPSPRNSQQPGR